MAIWGLVALVVQLLAFVMTRLLFKDLTQGIQNNNVAKGTFLGILSLSFGILNAACMTY
jgi:putative membrane protein